MYMFRVKSETSRSKQWHSLGTADDKLSFFGSTVITNPSPFFSLTNGLLSHNPQCQCPALLAGLPHSMPHFPGTEKHQTTTQWSHIREDLVVRGRGGFLRHHSCIKMGWSLIKTDPKYSYHLKSKMNKIKQPRRVFPHEQLSQTLTKPALPRGADGSIGFSANNRSSPPSPGCQSLRYRRIVTMPPVVFVAVSHRES